MSKQPRAEVATERTADHGDWLSFSATKEQQHVTMLFCEWLSKESSSWDFGTAHQQSFLQQPSVVISRTPALLIEATTPTQQLAEGYGLRKTPDFKEKTKLSSKTAVKSASCHRAAWRMVLLLAAPGDEVLRERYRRADWFQIKSGNNKEKQFEEKSQNKQLYRVGKAFE